MAVVQISDIYDPVVFANEIDEKAIELNKFLNSGVAVRDARIDGMAAVGGTTGELPFYQPLGTDEPNYSDDSPNTSTPKNISTGLQVYRRAMMNQSWSTMDVATELTSMADPADAITSKIAQYWATQKEKRVIYSCLGVLADNVANDSGDMVNDIATDDAAAITDAERVSADAVIDANLTLGDHSSRIGVIAMHSVVFGNLKKQNLIDYIPNARGEVNIPTYLGMTVVEDDSLPAVAGSNRVTYTSILFERGAFGFGSAMPLNASELERTPAAGLGGGQETIFSRRTDIIHPYGWAFLSASISGQSATLAELNDATEWNRVYAERKSAGLVFLQTNG